MRRGRTIAGMGASWRAELAVSVVSTPGVRILDDPSARAITLAVMRRALAGTPATDHATAFELVADQGVPARRLPLIVAVALAAALRANDRRALAHFTRGCDPHRDDHVAAVERCARAVLAEQPAAARQLRALVGGIPPAPR